MKPVYAPTDPKEKAMQRALLQWKRPDKRGLVIQALHEAGRNDLIGFSKNCLIRPDKKASPATEENVRADKPSQSKKKSFDKSRTTGKKPEYSHQNKGSRNKDNKGRKNKR
jgi:hypothetical protein